MDKGLYFSYHHDNLSFLYFPWIKKKLKKLVSHSIDVNVFHFFCHLREGEAYINMVQIINHCTCIVRTYLPCDSNLFFVRLYRLKCRNFLFVYIAFAICYHAWQCELYESMLVYASLYPHESLVIIINVFHNADITGSIAQLYIHCTWLCPNRFDCSSFLL